MSGWTGDNLIERSDKMKWYTGPTLVEALDQMKPPKRPTDRPLRLPLQGVYKISGIGTVPCGRVETGVLKPNMKLLFAPGGTVGLCKTVEMHHTAVPQAIPGDNVGFNVKGVGKGDIKRGYVASDETNEPARVCKEFQGTGDHPVPPWGDPGRVHAGAGLPHGAHCLPVDQDPQGHGPARPAEPKGRMPPLRSSSRGTRRSSRWSRSSRWWLRSSASLRRWAGSPSATCGGPLLWA